MVSILEGQLTRTWYYQTDIRRHTLSLYHDTITGIRTCAVDFEEVPNSFGYSTLVMEAGGHRVYFDVENKSGYFVIQRNGWIGFSYSCYVNGILLTETTQEVPKHQDPIYSTKIVDIKVVPDPVGETEVAWYQVVTTRLTDNVITSVHRRFREFADLNSQVKQNFKGHHLRSSIPEFPEKTPKYLTDHRDPSIMNERMNKLNNYLNILLTVPHVSDMTCIKAFVGLMEQVKEISYSFHLPTLGLNLIPSSNPTTPCVIGKLHMRVMQMYWYMVESNCICIIC